MGDCTDTDAGEQRNPARWSNTTRPAPQLSTTSARVDRDLQTAPLVPAIVNTPDLHSDVPEPIEGPAGYSDSQLSNEHPGREDATYCDTNRAEWLLVFKALSDRQRNYVAYSRLTVGSGTLHLSSPEEDSSNISELSQLDLSIEEKGFMLDKMLEDADKESLLMEQRVRRCWEIKALRSTMIQDLSTLVQSYAPFEGMKLSNNWDDLESVLSLVERMANPVSPRKDLLPGPAPDSGPIHIVTEINELGQICTYETIYIDRGMNYSQFLDYIVPMYKSNKDVENESWSEVKKRRDEMKSGVWCYRVISEEGLRKKQDISPVEGTLFRHALEGSHMSRTLQQDYENIKATSIKWGGGYQGRYQVFIAPDKLCLDSCGLICKNWVDRIEVLDSVKASMARLNQDGANVFHPEDIDMSEEPRMDVNWKVVEDFVNWRHSQPQDLDLWQGSAGDCDDDQVDLDALAWSGKLDLSDVDVD